MIIAKDIFDHCDSEVSELVMKKLQSASSDLEKLFGAPKEIELLKAEGIAPFKELGH